MGTLARRKAIGSQHTGKDTFECTTKPPYEERTQFKRTRGLHTYSTDHEGHDNLPELHEKPPVPLVNKPEHDLNLKKKYARQKTTLVGA